MNDKPMTGEETGDIEFTRRMELFQRNGEWMLAHGAPLYDQHRGRYIAVSQGEVFVADSDDEAARLAKEKHPDDEPYVEMIPRFPSPFTFTIQPASKESIRRSKLYGRNGEWMSEHGQPLYQQHRGKYVAVSEGEVFVSEDAWEAERQAKEKHPHDEPFVIYIPKAKYERIYAYRGPLARV